MNTLITARHSESDAAQIAKKIFGVNGSATSLNGEYDSNFHIKSENGAEYLLKISHPDAEESIVAMQNDVLLHLQQSTSLFRTPVLQRSLSGENLVRYDSRLVRLFDYMPGELFADVSVPSPALLQSLGYQLAQMTLALQDYQHDFAKRYLKWDLQQSNWITEQLSAIDNDNDRKCVEFFIDKYLKLISQVLPTLRQSVIHSDINDYNIIVSTNGVGDEKVSGFIDFGDVVKSATICELAIAVTYIMLNKTDPFAAAIEVVKAYHSIFPLQTAEINLLFPLICIRLCVSVVNSAIRKKENPDDTYLIISEKPAWKLLNKLREINSDNILRDACHIDVPTNKSAILQARKKTIGKNISLSYQNPLLIVRGQRQFLFDEQGRKYLDCVNNVSHVGHCHPKVVMAGQRQMATLNTNTRYLHPYLVNYAERLLATLPAPLEVCYFVCSGSEANELALRLSAVHLRNNNILVLDHAYHGNTSSLINISPYKFNGKGGKGKPDNVDVLPLPQATNKTIASIEKSVTFICESLPSCAGQIVLPENYLKNIYSIVRKNDGICIADEVQVGLGRVGSHFWGFETQDVIPDIVTMGKPLGNGHPIGAVVTTKEIADSFSNGMEYFNTFGGNPVSCAIGLSVLDVIEDEKLQKHAMTTGHYLKKSLSELQFRHPVITDVRGEGLFLGIEFADIHEGYLSLESYTNQVVNRMQERGVLISSDGPLHNVLKIKPPLVFNKQDCDVLVSSLDEVLSLSI